MVEEWFIHPRTLALKARLKARLDGLARSMYLGASSISVENLRLLAGEIKGTEQALMLLDSERREPE